MVALNVLYGLIKSITNEDMVVVLLLDPNKVSAMEGQIPKNDDCFSSMKTWKKV